MRWIPDMEMSAGRLPRDRVRKRSERDPLTAKVFVKPFALGAVRMNTDVHRIAMIPSHSIVGRVLAHRCDARVFTELLAVCLFDLIAVFDGRPGAVAGVF
jgi:hypothetical protein